MPRYIGIQHTWFIDSKGWDIIHLDSTNYEDALKEAALLQVDLMSSFNHCAIKVIEIGTDEHVVRRKLSWKKRLLGKVFYGNS